VTLPEGVQPSGPTEDPTATEAEATVTEAPVVTEPDTTEVPATVEEPAEDATDAELRAWARDHGMENVPTSGRLSAAWREQITAAMAAAALDPKEEASAEATSTEPSTSETTTEDAGQPWITDPAELAQFKDDIEAALEADAKLAAAKPFVAEEPVVEYRTPYVAPDTWVTGQAYTA